MPAIVERRPQPGKNSAQPPDIPEIRFIPCRANRLTEFDPPGIPGGLFPCDAGIAGAAS